MDLPQQFPYRPRLWLILFNLGAGCAWLGVQRVESSHWPQGFRLWFGLLPLALGLLTGLQRLVFRRDLLLGKNELTLPTGFLNLRTATIGYGTLERVWRVYLPLTVVLRITTKQRCFQVVSVLLPDNASYLAVEKFLLSRAQQNWSNQHGA